MTLEEAGAVTAPLAAERTEVAGRKESGPPSWDGRLPQRGCHGTAVKFLGLRSGTLLAGPGVRRPGTLSAWAARGAGAALPARASMGLRGGRGPGPLPLRAGCAAELHALGCSRAAASAGRVRSKQKAPLLEDAAVALTLGLVMSTGRCWGTWGEGRGGRCCPAFRPARGSSPLCRGAVSRS